jgi:hypothetical protein
LDADPRLIDFFASNLLVAIAQVQADESNDLLRVSVRRGFPQILNRHDRLFFLNGRAS